MKSFKQYLRQTLYESDPQKYDDVGKKIDNEISEVPVWRGGIPPSEIVDDQVWQTDEELEKDEEQQAKNREEKQAKRWVKRYNEKLMAQQQERRMQPPGVRGAFYLKNGVALPRELPVDNGEMQPPSAPGARRDIWSPALQREMDRESDDEQRYIHHKANQKEIWNRSQNRGVKFLPDPERVRQQEWDDMRARQREYDPEADAHRDGASRGG